MSKITINKKNMTNKIPHDMTLKHETILLFKYKYDVKQIKTRRHLNAKSWLNTKYLKVWSALKYKTTQCKTTFNTTLLNAKYKYEIN